MKFIVYIIESQEGYRYTGITTDITERIEQHNARSLSKWTKRGSNWKLIYSEEISDKVQAHKREKWLKSGAGREYINTFLKK